MRNETAAMCGERGCEAPATYGVTEHDRRKTAQCISATWHRCAEHAEPFAKAMRKAHREMCGGSAFRVTVAPLDGAA